ncbi:Neutral/alkaline nonlysosomal ceramidase [Neolentinus lepideus HHB14362 ss-1]|uniref:Neutral ceramidase n=2 Tax=Neolentinus lepideus HHB14362 ss-1 TaxID=1314782 RepID=A0A165MNQ3_9AGAM|nr:Neutral/alkaline nonlysosomal ceramidase [Neolentinus lepideus HHB14362 ss-1]
MPALDPGGLQLPFDLWSLSRSILNCMYSGLLYFTAFLASASVFPGHGGASISAASAQYLLGLGIADVTGPVVETNMMGYANLAQTDTGLHLRQRARAWIVADASDPSSRVVYINADIAMGDTGVRRSIVNALSAQYPNLYSAANIALGSTHQHSGVGGYLENLLPQVTSLGRVKETVEAIVNGTVLAVQRAHDSLAPGVLRVGNTSVVDGNRNRSPTAYLANPESERAQYEYDQDKTLSLLRFEDTSGNARGFLSFYAVHGTSLYENNTLVSSDNKGMAAHLYEYMVEPNTMPGNNTFVAGFTQSNVGDTSPNTLGAYCESPGQPWDGLPCEAEHSTCGNKTEDCHGRGPGFRISDFESNRIIAQLQVDGAKTVMDQGSSLAQVSGTVKSVHVYLNMSYHSFTLANGSTAQTCPPALGYGFAGGTSDGPGAFDFIQGDNSSQPQNPFWELVKGAITPYPPPEQVACHYPKPILLDTGYANTPYPWSPHVVDIQILKIGNFVILVMPGELTTMAGRRMRDAIRTKLISNGVLGDDAYVVVAGPANTYGHYIATREEYSVQRYEGASTLFGPFTLEAYIDKYSSLVPYLGDTDLGDPSSDDAPPDLSAEAISLQTGVIVDHPPLGKNFGNVLKDVSGPYTAGQTVFAQFVGANPRNNLRLEQTFLTVDKLSGSEWSTYRTDSHPSTIYQWERTSTVLGTSTVNISWTIEDGTPSGTYRLTYSGDAKSLLGKITPFTGTSSTFTVS